jgi:hypothetical protein
MDAINCVVAVPFVILALFFVLTGWQRGLRFNFHDYQGNSRERMRDNFFSSLNIITGISCAFPIIASIKLWGFAVPLILLSIVVVTPLAMLGASFSSFLGVIMTSGKIRDHAASWLGGKDLSTLEWYEYTPFAFVAGWLVYYLVYISLLLILRIKITSDVVPIWIVITGLILGITAGVILTTRIHKRFG